MQPIFAGPLEVSAGTIEINGTGSMPQIIPALNSNIQNYYQSAFYTCGPAKSTAGKEASITANPSPGFGTHITGGSVANRLDQGVNGNTSLNVYKNCTNLFTGLPY